MEQKSTKLSYIKMSRMLDGRHRSNFPFMNPFKIGRTKDSYLSTKLNNIQKIFEETLAVGLRKLKPEEGSDIPSFSWMTTAMSFLSDIHREMNSLIAALEFPVSNWEQQWIDLYLDDSVKLLDVCNAFSSELSRFGQCQLMLRCVLHMLSEASGTPSEDQLKKAHNYLKEWRQQIDSGNTKLDTSSTILTSLSQSLHVANFKKSPKGKVLMRALYAVKAVTVFVCSVLSAALTGSSQLLTDFHVSEEFPWAKAFNDLRSDVNQEIRRKFLCKRVVALNGMDAVSRSVDRLVSLTSDSALSMQTASQPCIAGEPKVLEDLPTTNVKDEKVVEIIEVASGMGTDTKILSHGLDDLSKEVRIFFQIVMKGRDALLGNLRSSVVFQARSLEKSKSQ